MNIELTHAQRRITGILGALGAMLLLCGDWLLFGKFAHTSGAEFYATYLQKMGQVPTWQLTLGGLLGPATLVFFLFGFLHVFSGLQKGNRILSLTCFSAFALMSIFIASYHACFTFIGLLLKSSSLNANMEWQETVLAAFLHYMDAIRDIAVFLGLLGVLSFIAIVLFFKTQYPKYTVLITPLFLLYSDELTLLLPSPIGGYLAAGFSNLIFLWFFVVSTVLLWNNNSPQKA